MNFTKARQLSRQICTSARQIIAIVCLMSAGTVHGATVVYDEATGYAVGIDGLVVGTVRYNVCFTAGSYDSVFASRAPTFLADVNGANAARDAIISVLNAEEGVPEITNLNSEAVFVPYELPQNDPSRVLTTVAGHNDSSDPWQTFGNTLSERAVDYPQWLLARFTPAPLSGTVVKYETCSGYAVGIENLSVNGVNYDVCFIDASYQASYGSRMPTFFGDYSGAIAASEAITSALNAEAVPPEINASDPEVVFVPFDIPEGDPGAFLATQTGHDTSIDPWQRFGDFLGDQSIDYVPYHFASFALSPELGTAVKYDPCTGYMVGIRDLVVQGGRYDVEFLDGSYDTVYATDPPSFLGMQSLATAARDAMASVLGAEPIVPELSAQNIENIWTPYDDMYQGDSNSFIGTIVGHSGTDPWQVFANTIGDKDIDYGAFLHTRFTSNSNLPLVVTLPDVSGDGVADLTVIRSGSIMAEIRDGQAGALQRVLSFFDGQDFLPVTAVSIPDSDGNGVAELAVLATRQSDGRIAVQIQNLAGASLPRTMWFAANHTPISMAVIADDADNNGVAELAVLSTRNSDGRGLVEIKNAFGPTNPNAIWSAAGFSPTDIEIVPDSDANGVPEIAVLAYRNGDKRVVVEIKNAAGPSSPNAVWFMPGNTPIDLAVVGDKDANNIPEVAVLSSRNSDGRNVVEVKNAQGAPNPSALWLFPGAQASQVQAVNDADSNGVPEVAVLSTRARDGRNVVEVKNAFGAVNPQTLWYSPGYSAKGLEILDDLDSNGTEEAGVFMIRDSDGRLLLQGRNASGSATPSNYWFSQ